MFGDGDEDSVCLKASYLQFSHLDAGTSGWRAAGWFAITGTPPASTIGGD